MNTLIMHFMLWLLSGLGLELELTLTLLITMIIQHYRCIMTHQKYVHSTVQMDDLSVIKIFNILQNKNAFNVS